METKNMFLKLFSNSFIEKLQNLKIEYNDVISIHLLEADEILKKYDVYCSPIPEDSFLADIKKRFTDTFSEELSSKITNYCRQITLKKDVFEVSFLPKYCDPVYTSSGNWDKKNRQSGKPGKIIQKLIGEGKFKNADYEQFVYRLKALWATGGYTIKLVKGEDIRYWYNEENYYSMSSTLGHSCMAHGECSSFFDLYCEQPECQMLIALKEGQLAARALVWTIGDKTFMDRVYYIEDSLYNIFVNYAKEHKWIIRDDNSLLEDGSSQLFRTPEDNYESCSDLGFQIKLKRFYSNFPYIDSFRYLDINNLYLSTTPEFSCMGYCSCTDGGYSSRDDEFCPNCETTIYEDERAYSEWYDIDGCVDCMAYSNCMDDYIPNNLAVSVMGVPYVDIACEEFLRDHPEEFICIDGQWYDRTHPRARFHFEPQDNESNNEPQIAQN